MHQVEMERVFTDLIMVMVNEFIVANNDGSDELPTILRTAENAFSYTYADITMTVSVRG